MLGIDLIGLNPGFLELCSPVFVSVLLCLCNDQLVIGCGDVVVCIIADNAVKTFTVDVDYGARCVA